MLGSAPVAHDVMNSPIAWLAWTGLHMSPWKLIGLTGAPMFGGRWLVQFVASRRHGKPVIPRLFWYMSLVGSVMTLAYFVFSSKQDSVGVIQNLFPAFTPVRMAVLCPLCLRWRSTRSSGFAACSARSASRVPSREQSSTYTISNGNRPRCPRCRRPRRSCACSST